MQIHKYNVHLLSMIDLYCKVTSQRRCNKEHACLEQATCIRVNMEKHRVDNVCIDTCRYMYRPLLRSDNIHEGYWSPQ